MAASNSNQSLASRLGKDLVWIYVGPRLTLHAVHKQLITSTCDFFKYAFDGRFKEGIENKMFMPEDDPEVFEAFVNWMYTKELGKELDSTQSIKLWIFAQKIQCIPLRNMAIDRLQDVLCGTSSVSCPTTLSYDEVKLIFQNTQSTDVYTEQNPILRGSAEPKGMRSFTIALLAWNSCKGTLRGLKEQERILKDIDGVLFEMLYEMRTGCGKNPRVRSGYDGFDMCYFHQHSNGEICTTKPTELVWYEDGNEFEDENGDGDGDGDD